MSRDSVLVSASDRRLLVCSDTNWNDYATCNTGIKQSPIDLVRPYFGAFLKLGMNYKDQEWPEQVPRVL